MKETTLTYCGECLEEFMPGQIVWFAWIENRCFCATCQSKLTIGQWEPRLVPEKESEDLVERIIDLANELHEVAQDTRFTFIIDGRSQPSVQMLSESFFENFKTFDIDEIGYGRYPYKALNDVEGVVFSALLTSSDYEKYVLTKRKG